jgi:hypothetical protein
MVPAATLVSRGMMERRGNTDVEHRRSLEEQHRDRAVWMQSVRYNQQVLRALFTRLNSQAEAGAHGFTYAIGPGAVGVHQHGTIVAYWTSAGGALHLRFHDDRHCTQVIDTIDQAVAFACQLVQDARPF